MLGVVMKYVTVIAGISHAKICPKGQVQMMFFLIRMISYEIRYEHFSKAANECKAKCRERRRLGSRTRRLDFNFGLFGPTTTGFKNDKARL